MKDNIGRNLSWKNSSIDRLSKNIKKFITYLSNERTVILLKTYRKNTTNIVKIIWY